MKNLEQKPLFRRRLDYSDTNHYQNYINITLSEVLQVCKGTENIADDIIVHGKTEKEHDERLACVFRWLSEGGLTKTICQFKMTDLESFGPLLSDREIGPTEARVAAIVNATEPQSAAEIRSFLVL